MPLSAWSTRADHPPAHLERFAEVVRASLTKQSQKRLSSEYFYDAVGSALFEAITVLPEYGLSRADARLLERHAGAIAKLAPAPVSVIELGSGSGTKTAHVLNRLAIRQGAVDYFPVDVSASALEHCRRELSKVAQVHTIEAGFVNGVREALRRIPKHSRVLLLFLGSTIGNFDRGGALAFLAELGAMLRRGDLLLIGADLVKPVRQLLLAYDDPAGVTAAFNRNLLGRINRELGGNFDLKAFRHEARYEEAHKRIEMHLVSERSQAVEIPGAECIVDFREGESIWTESSHKYDRTDLEEMARAGGFRVIETWIDLEWPFAECLWEVI